MSGKEPVRVLVVTGPTAVGKTAFIERLASGNCSFRGEAGSPFEAAAAGTPFEAVAAGTPFEVISADSVQVYRGLDKGTAKPPLSLRERVPHHLLDICGIHEQFTAGDFVRQASQACRDIASRGRVPVVSGGTGFYIANLVYGLPGAPPADPGVREKLRKEMALRGAESLYAELAEHDVVSAQKIHKNDTNRLLRALEVYRQTGQPLSAFTREGQGRQEETVFTGIVLDMEREALYARIERRCEAMWEEGLPEEVKGLYERGLTPELPALRAIGYREFFDWNAETGKWALKKDFNGVLDEIKTETRRYAKRQITYFARFKDWPRLS